MLDSNALLPETSAQLHCLSGHHIGQVKDLLFVFLGFCKRIDAYINMEAAKSHIADFTELIDIGGMITSC